MRQDDDPSRDVPLSRFNEVLVHDLRDEHKDREWVSVAPDTYGGFATHPRYAWCEDTWMMHPGYSNSPWRKIGGIDPAWGPFMEALHYRVIWERH